MEALAILAALLLISGPIATFVAVAKLREVLRRLEEMRGSQRQLQSQMGLLLSRDERRQREARRGEATTAPAQPKPVSPEKSPPPVPVTAQTTVPVSEKREVKKTPAEPWPALSPSKVPEKPGTPVPAPAPKKPAEKKAPSPIVESVNEILGKIWSWILVGEEFRPKNVSMEYAVASTWLMRSGIVAIVACMAFFLRWSITQGILTEWARVGLSIFAGVAMLVGGVRLVGRKYNIIGQGLLGGGAATLYASMYAAGPMYGLIGIPLTFLFMIMVTATAGVLAIRTNSMLIAILGIIGGYCTPVVLSTGVPQFMVLFSYMLVLSLGVLGIAHYKQWRLLNYLAFVFTYGISIGALERDYTDGSFPVAITFMSLYFVLHAWVVLYYNVLRKKKATVLEIIHTTANAIIYAGIGYYLIEDTYLDPYPAIMTLALAAFYVVHVYIFVKRKLIDRNLLITFVSLAGLFTALSLPIIFEKQSLTIALSLLAITYLSLGLKMDSNFIRSLSYIIYMIVFGRLLFLDTPHSFNFDSGPRVPFEVYRASMLNRLWTFGISILSVLGAFFIQRKGVVSISSMSISRENDIREVVPSGLAKGVFYWFGTLFLFAFLQMEFHFAFGYFEPLRLPVLTLLWCGMAVYFLWRYFSTGSRAMFGAMVAFITIAVVKVLSIDLMSWDVSERFLYTSVYDGLGAGMRLLDFGSVIAFLLLAWVLLPAGGEQKPVRHALGYGGLALMFLYLTLEVNSCLYHLLPGFRHGGISTLWAFLAIAYIAGGIWKDVKPLRFIGLLLFAVVVGKAFLLDLDHIKGIYRVIAFMCVGVFLMIGSFAYVHSGGKFTSNPDEDVLTDEGDDK